MTVVRPPVRNTSGINASARCKPTSGRPSRTRLNTFTYTATALTVNAGTYTLGEIDVDGYTEGPWDPSERLRTAVPSARAR